MLHTLCLQQHFLTLTKDHVFAIGPFKTLEFEKLFLEFSNNIFTNKAGAQSLLCSENIFESDMGYVFILLESTFLGSSEKIILSRFKISCQSLHQATHFGPVPPNVC